MLIGYTKLENLVRLDYKGENPLYVNVADFNRAFGTIVNCTRDQVLAEFAIKTDLT